MMERTITKKQIEAFETHLIAEEKSPHTIAKYIRDAEAFCAFAAGQPVTKELVISYKTHLIAQQYEVGSINSMLTSVNCLLKFLGWGECCVRCLKVQRKIYCPEERELSRAEYLRLLAAAKNDPRLYLLLQAICGTGIRVSELAYFTVEAVKSGFVTVRCKNKLREILIPKTLKKQLLAYASKNGIDTGSIFCTKTGKPLNRSNIWAMMKRLCKVAGVAATKVFPHNLRKLFAKSFYKAQKDVVKLADILGHSSINTTRIYLMSNIREHQRLIERLGLVIEKSTDTPESVCAAIT